MAIVFAHNIEVPRKAEPGEPQPGREWAEISAARGQHPRPMTRAEYLALPILIHSDSGDVLDTSSLKGQPVQLKPGAFTDEELKIIYSGELRQASASLLNTPAYGYKWRVWVDGYPTLEEMDATPWEELG